MRSPRLNALTADAVRRIAKGLEPEPVRKWALSIEDKQFPIKQIVRAAANSLQMDAPLVTPADFIAHDAVRILRRLGFEKQLRYEN